MNRKLPSATGLQRALVATIAAFATVLTVTSIGGLVEHYAAGTPAPDFAPVLVAQR